MKRWIRFIGHRLLYMVTTLWIIVTITFFLMNLLPGTPYSNRDKLTQAQLQVMDAKYGLNDPLYKRYLTYINNIFHGDFGISLQFSDQKVTTLLGSRIGVSIQLGLQAVLLGTLTGILLGTIAAMKHNTWIDTFCSLFAIIGRSAPNFVVAVVLQYIFAVSLGLLPIGLWKNNFISSILPTLALAISPMADTSRFIRAEMIEVLSSDYIELARAKGMSELRLVMTHGLRNALIPMVTIVGPLTVSLITGSMVVENIFAIPGIGEQFTKSVLSNDYSTIMAVTILFSALLVLVIFLMDVIYQLIDPRIRIGQRN